MLLANEPCFKVTFGLDSEWALKVAISVFGLYVEAIRLMKKVAQNVVMPLKMRVQLRGPFSCKLCSLEPTQLRGDGLSLSHAFWVINSRNCVLYIVSLMPSVL